MKPRTLCVLSPHRDDAAFSCGLILQSALSAGATIRVVNVCTQSRYAPYLPEANENMVVTSARRKREDDEFADRLIAAAKVDRAMLEMDDLGWMDAPIRWNMSADETLGDRAMRSEEVSALAEELARFGQADVVLAPMAIGGHVDHRLVKAAALLSYTSAQLALYEELPYAARSRNVEIAGAGTLGLEECQQGNQSSRETWHWREWSRRSYPPQHLALTAMKYQYALCYASQIDDSTAREIGDYSDSLGGRERVWGSISVLDRIDEIFHES